MIDPQTSGGLLVALPQDYAEEALTALYEVGVVRAKKVGTVGAKSQEVKLHLI